MHRYQNTEASFDDELGSLLSDLETEQHLEKEAAAEKLAERTAGMGLLSILNQPEVSRFEKSAEEVLEERRITQEESP